LRSKIFCLSNSLVRPAIKKFMVVLAVLAVATVQLFGARIGYLCACTGGWSQEAACKTVLCHPADNHHAASAASACSERSDTSNGHDHEHDEVRTTLPMTTAVPMPSLPIPVFFELPDLFQPSVLVLAALVRETLVEVPRPEDDRSTSASLVVVRTKVMLV
jgi:hypothetical protein